MNAIDGDCLVWFFNVQSVLHKQCIDENIEVVQLQEMTVGQVIKDSSRDC